MFNILSILIGMVALPISLIGFIPLLGWLNWFAVPLAAGGAAMGTLSGQKSGRNLNLLVVLLGGGRLMLGGGIF
jgi:hypothetical protein